MAKVHWVGQAIDVRMRSRPAARKRSISQSPRAGSATIGVTAVTLPAPAFIAPGRST
jgi:hypothetical protein